MVRDPKLVEYKKDKALYYAVTSTHEWEIIVSGLWLIPKNAMTNSERILVQLFQKEK